ncbi:hypothetical protein EHQ58_14085 [Leptospira ognonensis]|uniref:Uncharacterized protein n=1 Tax=Leptospira ognonensis TaxID=2484945 RepID=A0A4R9JWN1_9LEPT|nr:hypothetical protein [Leptospira ognonensis]TGL57413.1 hypothetical protein EHQ58_14085 [Leptospira ognonensis]
MVNLFEPFLISLLRKHQVSLATAKTEERHADQVRIPDTKLFSKITSASKQEGTADLPIGNVGVKASFFSPWKTERWLEILKDTKSTTSEDTKPHWNFLFPEIPWSSERIYWRDEKSKSQFFGTLGKNQDTFCLCLLFDSLRTGKVWIYIEHSVRPESSCAIIFQTEKDFMKRKIEQDKSLLQKELKNLGNIRISVETNNDNLVKMTQIQRGILV